MKVAIIGSGCSGLTAIKCCLDEGLDPVCYERTDDIGGLWNYKEEVRPGQGSVAKSTVINTSKESMSFSDYPMPTEYPMFMHNKLVLEYFRKYANHFDLLKHIKFQHEIVSIKKRSDFTRTGQWSVTVRDKIKGTTEDLVYDAVIVCTGHHAEANIPSFPGLEKFKGKVIHSHDYKQSKGYENQRVVIIGIGNSAGDAAVELCQVASQVYLSTRKGAWVLNRISDNGKPFDMVILNRFFALMATWFPNYMNSYMESKVNARFDHEAYALRPKHRIFQQHPTVNDELPNKIVSGKVMVRSNVAEFTETGVRFDDGTFEDNIDVVYLATGYIFGFPFLDKSVVDVKNNEVNLFKWEFPPDLEKNTLAIIGCFQPVGALMPISELQCRLATRVFKGDVTLPSREGMWKDIRSKKNDLSKSYVKSLRHTMQVDYVLFQDELARLNGCSPNFMKLWITDPVLAFKCYFGPCTPYQFRLHGPGAWKGARNAIMTQWERLFAPLKTRPLRLDPPSSQFGFITYFVLLLSIVVVLFCYFYEW